MIQIKYKWDDSRLKEEWKEYVNLHYNNTNTGGFAPDRGWEYFIKDIRKEQEIFFVVDSERIGYGSTNITFWSEEEKLKFCFLYL